MRDSSPYRIAITATFTSEPIASALEFWSKPLSANLEIAFAPFDQVMQSLLDPGSVLRTNNHGLNVVLFRYGNMGGEMRRAENLEALRQTLISLPPGNAPFLVVPCPDEQRFHDEEFLSSLEANANVYGLSSAWIAERYPVATVYSPEGERLGGIPYTEDYFIALAASIVRFAHSLQHPPAKVLALDCDNTLWQGVCGEDGPEGVTMTAGHEALQRFAVEQREQGTLLVLASKNNLAEVEATFAAHPEFPLEWRHITAHRINWDPKPKGLASLAAELSLGLDSFLFLDDNHKEVAEVSEELPGVMSLALPERSIAIEEYVHHLWALDRFRLTDTDRGRAASYEQTQEFGRALGSAVSLASFYAHLELKVRIQGIVKEDFPRASQLTQRTNQFNFTTLRRGEAQIQELWESHSEIFRIDVADRFGDYGFTGLLVGKVSARQYLVDTFLLSCRVLGRGVEHAVMRWLAQHALRLGLREVTLPFAETAKNQPASAFLAGLGGTAFPFTVPAEVLAATELRADEAPLVAPASEERSETKTLRTIDYSSIALELSSVEKIKRAMRPESSVAHGQFATATELRLALLWQELLPSAAPAPESNFFELGGHSLLAVLLLTRINESLGVELGIDEVYSIDMTLERMARRIDELLAFSGLRRKEYELLCAEIARLSDTEVADALALEEREELSPAYAHSSSR